MRRATWIALGLCSLASVGCNGCNKKKDAAADAGAGPLSNARRAGFRLSDADAEKPAPRSVVRGEPLSVEQTEELLVRLPKPPDADDGATRFALRAGSKPPPRPGREIATPFPPPPTASEKPEHRGGKLTVLRRAPVGDVPIAPNVSVTFSEPMVEITSVGALADKNVPVKISPAPPTGAFRWAGTQTVVFQPDKELPKATSYAVEIPAGTASVTGAKLAAVERFTFTTPPPTLVGSHPYGSDQRSDALMFVELDQRISAEALIAETEVLVDGLDYKARLATPEEVAKDETVARLVEQADKKGKGRTIAFFARAPFPASSRVEVKLRAGTPSAEGPLKTKEPQSFSFSVRGPLQATISCTWSPKQVCHPDATLSVGFSSRIDHDVFDEELVTVSPLPDGFKRSVSGQVVELRGAWKLGQKYEVIAKKGVRDVHGQSLANDAKREFEFSPFEPQLFRETRILTSVDPAARGPKGSFYSRNEGPVRARLYRVSPEQWPAFVAFRRKWDNDSQRAEPPGQLVFDQEIEPLRKPDATTETSIDLAPALAAGKGHVVMVVESKRPYDKRWEKEWVRQWIQVTQLGISALSAPDGSLTLFASDLAHGAPVAGATFALSPLGRSATADGEGIATIAGPFDRAPDGGILVARSGGDAAFVPHDPRGMRPITSELRFFGADDRETYKPRETVSIKGLFRRASTVMPGEVDVPPELIGKSLAWSARDARGAELAKGRTAVDETGGVFVAFKLPDNANLGQATFTIDAPGARASESFAIQEFRRPEYEVSADVTAGPHVFGGRAIASAKAAYYAGGGLPAAETKWNVSRSDATFSPPNRGEYHFGRRPSQSFFYFEEVGSDAPDKTDLRSLDWEGRTDASGVHRLRIDLDGTAEPYPFTLAATATITDVNRQAWSASTSLLVHPARVYAGLKLEKSFVRAGEPIVVDVIAANLDGAFVKGRKVRVRAARLVSQLVKGRYRAKEVDEVVCETTTSDGPAPKACSLATKQPGSHLLVADVEDESGKKSRTSMSVWVTGRIDDADRSVRPNSIELTPDKMSYRPGETAQLLVKAPFAPAEGFVHVSGGVASRRERIKLTERTQVIPIRIDDRDVTSLGVTLSLVGSMPRTNERGEVDPSLGTRPAYTSARASVLIEPAARRLHVTAKPRSDAVAPGAETSLAIDVKDAAGAAHAAELAVIVADEAVLALSSYTLDDPLSVFYVSTMRPQAAFDSRAYLALAPHEDRHAALQLGDPSSQWGNIWGDGIGDVFGSGGLGLSGVGEGGGGRGEGIGLGNIGTIGHGGDAPPPPDEPSARPAPSAALREASEFGMIGLITSGNKGGPPAPRPKGTPIAMRSNFEALALFAARVKTDATGHADVPFKLPESTSRYRVMVVAWDKKDRFGTGESSITTRLPLLVRPSAPRFLNYGDRFELPVVLQNQTGEKMRVAVAARAFNASMIEATGRAVDVPPNDRVEVRLPAQAKQPGRARFQIAAAAGGSSDAADVDLPVWTPGTTEAFATYGVIDEGTEKQTFVMPEGVEKEFGGLDVSTSSTALFALSDAVLYLVRYPFDCNEQIASRVVSIAALRDVLAAFKASALPSPDVLRAGVAKDLAMLKARQDSSSGGFGFWGERTWPYLTVHVAFALSLAKEKGFLVDPRMLEQVKRYLKSIDTHFDEYHSAESRRSIKSYAAFTLRRLGEPDLPMARAVAADAGGIDKLPLESLAWLLPTFAGDPAGASEAAEIKRVLSTRVTETAGAAHFVTSYGESDWLLLGSTHRTDALVLYALLETDPKSDLLPKLVTGLLGARKKGHWSSTQEDAFVLLALDAYFQKFEKVAPSFVARVWLGDKTASERAFKGRNVDRVETTIPMPELAKLGRSDLLVEKDGAGRLYYRLGLRYVPSSLVLPALERGFSVARRYEPVDDPSSIKRDADGTIRVKAGTTIRVRVTMTAPAERHHVALVDPMPAGFEAVNPALAVSTPVVQKDDGPKRSSWGWWRTTWYEHQNLRDERAEAFASLVSAGVYEYVYTARATTPGTFVVPPAKAEEMYSPEVFGRSAGERVVVE